MSSRSWSSRWQDASGTQLAARVLQHLLHGEPLDGLPLDRHDGRFDLRGFVVPTPDAVGVGIVSEERDDSEHTALDMRWLSGLVEFRDVNLVDLDLSNARLDNLRFFDATVENCVFDKAKCRDWRGWNLTIKECSFIGSTLRNSALGTWHNGLGNRYQHVNFTKADVRDTTCMGATFVECVFSETRLDKVEFSACNFADCRFDGVLEGVRFLAEPLIEAEDLPSGSMRDVDFSGSVLRWTEFRGLPLDGVTLPAEGDEHVIVNHYPCVVRRAVDRLNREPAAATRTLHARLLASLENLDDSRRTGLWHRDELGTTPEQQQIARAFLHELDRECAADSRA